MQASIKVVKTRFFAAVKGGTYTFTNVPPGRYKVGAWSPATNEVLSPDLIEIGLGDTKTAETIKLNSIPIDTEHLRKDGTPYKPGGYP